MLLKRYLIRADRCANCQQCLAVCPVGAIEPTAAGIPVIRNAECRRCGACKKLCKQRAITVSVKLQF